MVEAIETEITSYAYFDPFSKFVSTAYYYGHRVINGVTREEVYEMNQQLIDEINQQIMVKVIFILLTIFITFSLLFFLFWKRNKRLNDAKNKDMDTNPDNNSNLHVELMKQINIQAETIKEKDKKISGLIKLLDQLHQEKKINSDEAEKFE